MNLLVIFILSLFIQFIIFLLLKITLDIDLAFNLHTQKLTVTIYFASRRLKKVVQILPPINKIKKKSRKKYKKRKPGFKIKSYRLLKRYIREMRAILKKSIRMSHFYLSINIGTDDVFDTTILYGILWSVFGTISSYVLNTYKPQNNKVEVIPDFNKEILNVGFNCIFSIRIVNIIRVGIIFIKWFINNRRGGDKNVKSSNRRTYEYSHGKH